MGARNLFLGSAVLLPLLAATPAQAQRVSADIIIGGGPVAGRITINDRNRYRPRPIRRVEWVRVRDHRRDSWFRKMRQHARVMVVYYDRRDDCYYYDRFAPGLDEIRVYEEDGRYYRLDDDRYYDDRYDRYDRDDRYDDRRYDDRRYDDRRYDSKDRDRPDRDRRDRDRRDWNDRN